MAAKSYGTPKEQASEGRDDVMVTPGKERNNPKPSYEKIDERDLLFHAWTYTGRRAKLSGEVTIISHDGDGTWMTLRIGPFPYWVTVVVRHTESLPQLQTGMVATVYGLCAGTERVRYDSPDIIGLTARRPLIQAEHIAWS